MGSNKQAEAFKQGTNFPPFDPNPLEVGDSELPF